MTDLINNSNDRYDFLVALAKQHGLDWDSDNKHDSDYFNFMAPYAGEFGPCQALDPDLRQLLIDTIEAAGYPTTDRWMYVDEMDYLCIEYFCGLTDEYHDAEQAV